MALTPYYVDGSVTIYHGDCREILPSLRVDAVVTDPPYGIGFEYATHDDNREGWYALMNEVVPLMREAARFVVMPCCGVDRLRWWYANHAPDWIIAWHKGSPGQLSHVGFSAWEAHLVWGKPKAQLHDHFKTVCGFDDNGHPCPKPIEWANWLVPRAAPALGLVLDPFMGSGTVLVSAKYHGRHAIGIEIDERYCEIAARRCSQEVLDLGDAA